MEEIALYRKFPKMKDFPRIELVNCPTPVEKLNNVSKILGMEEIWVKRDDLTNEVYGGNKSRKFEFMLGDAIKKGKKNIITIGGIGSNHALANTVFCNILGLNSIIYLINQPLLKIVRKNLLCDYYYGAKMIYNRSELSLGLKILLRLIVDRKSYLIMPGASVPLGTIGFVNAGLELAEQIKNNEMPEPDHLFVAVGSAGTCAGLTLGLELAGLKTQVHGVRVAFYMFTKKKAVLKLAKKTLKLMRKIDPSIPDVSKRLKDRLTIHHDFYGEEYGRITYEGLSAIDVMKEDDIHLETTYTAKAFSGLLHQCREYCDEMRDKTIVFWNTHNSRDLTPIAEEIVFKDLPKALHKFFNGKVPLDDIPVNAKKLAKK